MPQTAGAGLMRLAIFYDYLQTIGGGERVALTLAKEFGGNLVTTDLDPGLPERAGFDHANVTNLGNLIAQPPFKQIHASWRFARARLRGYDAHVFVGNWAHFAAKRHHPNLYYCLTPTRSFYDQREAILRRLSIRDRTLAMAWMAFHRRFDQRAVGHCDRVVAISEVVRRRIRRYYRLDADVIYPPVATARFRFEEIGDYWLSVGRMYPEKRVELQLDIFRRLPREKLVIVGGYSRGDRADRYLATLHRPPNVTFLGEIPVERLSDLYARCRGLLTTAVDEDFGITPVEAMASGKCVLATDEGGYRETVVDGETGFLLPPRADPFVDRIRSLDDGTLRAMRARCEARARDFDESAFVARMKEATGWTG